MNGQMSQWRVGVNFYPSRSIRTHFGIECIYKENLSSYFCSETIIFFLLYSFSFSPRFFCIYNKLQRNQIINGEARETISFETIGNHLHLSLCCKFFLLLSFTMFSKTIVTEKKQ